MKLIIFTLCHCVAALFFQLVSGSSQGAPQIKTTPSKLFENRVNTCIVVGAGPAGLACSLGLARTFRVHLVEKHSCFEVRGASFHLAPNGEKALEEMCPGIGVELNEKGIHFHPKSGLLMPWWTIRDILLNWVRKNPNIALYTDMELIDVIEDDDGVSAVFRKGAPILKGSFLVAADGVHSSVRELLGLSPCTPTGNTVFRGSVDATGNAELEPLLEKSIFNPMGSCTYNGTQCFGFHFHSKIPGQIAWVVSTCQPVDPNRTTPYTLLEDAMPPEMWKIWKALFDASPADSMKPSSTPGVIDFSDNVLAAFGGRWGGRGRITLIGDAAHAMRATDGQGGSQAFEDGVILSRLMKLDEHKQVASRLKEFEETRLARVKLIHENQQARYLERLHNGGKFLPWPSEFKEWVESGV